MKTKHMVAYMETAEAFAKCSTSTRLSVGAILVKDNHIVSCGYNALPKHLDGSLEGPDGQTLPEVRHAEKNALMALTKSNESSVGATLFCTHAPCKSCAIDIVDAGITTVYYQDVYRSEEGIIHLNSCGVSVFTLRGGEVNRDMRGTLIETCEHIWAVAGLRMFCMLCNEEK